MSIKSRLEGLKSQNIKENIRKLNKPIFWLTIIFLIILGIRLYIAFQTDFFNYDAYYDLRQIESIRETGLPEYRDSLSYGGKTNLFAPLNHYIIAFFALFMPAGIAGKIVPNIIAALIIFVVYNISLKLTKNTKISIFTAMISGLIPIHFIDINRISINYTAILLILTIIYCMLKIGERKYVDYALILMFLLVLTTPLAFILVLGLLIYLLLLKLENHQIEMKELEIILFYTFLVFWVNLLIYKNSFLTHGLLVIWQNIPVSMLSNFFSDIGFLEALATIGLIPIIFGVYAFYSAMHQGRDKDILLIISLTLSTFVLIWFKLLDLITGLMFLGISLTILTAYSFKKIGDFIVKSKIHKYDKILQVFLIAIFFITTIPAIISIVNSDNSGPYDTPTINDIIVLEWASQNTPKNAMIVSGLEEGNIVSYYAQRKNLMDTNFLLTPRIDQRLEDLNTIYSTSFETQAIGIMNTYKAKYLLVTPKAIRDQKIPEISYLKDNQCFQLEYYNGNTQIYKLECKIK
jgi:hypothetical protein